LTQALYFFARFSCEKFGRNFHQIFVLHFQETFDLKSVDQKFDVILIEPPLEEYARSHGVTNVKFWDWDKIMALDIGELAAHRSFIFLWYAQFFV
jgi:hypothetical protein